MALNITTNITNTLDGYSLDAKQVKGTHVVVANIAERDSLPVSTTIKGSSCYVSSEDKYYIWSGTAWELGILTRAETQTELNKKQDTLVSGTNIKTINNTSLLGSGNLDIHCIASEVILTDDITVQNTVGGLTEGMALKGLSVAEIIRRLVTGSVPPVGVYKEVYYGEIGPNDTITNLNIDGTLTYSSKTKVISSNDKTSDKLYFHTTDDVNKAVIISKKKITDIKFMVFSDMDNWNESQVTYTDSETQTSQNFYLYLRPEMAAAESEGFEYTITVEE